MHIPLVAFLPVQIALQLAFPLPQRKCILHATPHTPAGALEAAQPPPPPRGLEMELYHIPTHNWYRPHEHTSRAMPLPISEWHPNGAAGLHLSVGTA